ncbi:hypothetical protein ES703_91796 [subsurface metagenome]
MIVSIAITLSGSAIATMILLSFSPMVTRQNRLATLSGNIRAMFIFILLTSSKRTYSIERCSARAQVTSSSLSILSRSNTSPSRPPRSRCSFSASTNALRLNRPLETRNSPKRRAASGLRVLEITCADSIRSPQVQPFIRFNLDKFQTTTQQALCFAGFPLT